MAVVCRPVTSLHFRDSSVSRDLAKQVSLLLEKNVSKIKLIDQREVFEWADENNWEEYAEIGKALNADMVVGIDLEEFSLYHGQTLYQGKANIQLAGLRRRRRAATRCSKRTCRRPSIRRTPPIPASDNQEAALPPPVRRSTWRGRSRHHFYDHDSTVDFANDSTAVQN